MGLFSKTEYKEIMLPFIIVQCQEDIDFGGISIEACGVIDGTMKYCYATYILKNRKMYENGEYEQLIEILDNFDGPVNILLKYKKDRLKDFEFNIDKLSLSCNDIRIKELELVGWGLNDKCFQDY